MQRTFFLTNITFSSPSHSFLGILQNATVFSALALKTETSDKIEIYDNKTLKSQHFAREKNPKGHIDFVMVHPKKHQSFANQGNKLSLDVCTVKR